MGLIELLYYIMFLFINNANVLFHSLKDYFASVSAQIKEKLDCGARRLHYEIEYTVT
jgi:hypothetical protein